MYRSPRSLERANFVMCRLLLKHLTHVFSSGGSPSPPNSLEDPEKGNGSSGRPVRAAVVTAAAISEAQNDILAKFDRFVLYATGIVWQMLSLILH